MNSLTLSIENMHCGVCIRRVTQALNAVPGTKVESVELGRARIESSATPEAILAAVAKTGFPTRIDR